VRSHWLKTTTLACGSLEDVIEQGQQFVGLVAVVGLVVDQEAAVARHAHVLQRTVQTQLVLVGEETGVAPALDDARDHLAVLFVMVCLQLTHRHEQGVVDALGQLFQYLRLAPAQQDRRQRLADPVQFAVADDASALVALLMFVEQAPGRPQAVLIDELDDRDQFFEPVFQGCAGQHDGVGAVDTLQRARGDGVPVLDPLCFVDDHHVRRPGLDQVEVAAQRFVVGDLAEVVLRITRLADARRPPMTVARRSLKRAISRSH
jgi:hypothetical protein